MLLLDRKKNKKINKQINFYSLMYKGQWHITSWALNHLMNVPNLFSKLVNEKTTVKVSVGVEHKGLMDSGRCVWACAWTRVTRDGVQSETDTTRSVQPNWKTQATKQWSKVLWLLARYPSDSRASMTLNWWGSVRSELEGKTRRHFEKELDWVILLHV